VIRFVVQTNKNYLKLSLDYMTNALMPIIYILIIMTSQCDVINETTVSDVQ